MISIKTEADSNRVTAIHEYERSGDGWVTLDQQKPQVGKANVQVTWYYRNGRLEFETEPAPQGEGP